MINRNLIEQLDAEVPNRYSLLDTFTVKTRHWQLLHCHMQNLIFIRMHECNEASELSQVTSCDCNSQPNAYDVPVKFINLALAQGSVHPVSKDWYFQVIARQGKESDQQMLDSNIF